jgi:hypothetical protein
MEIAFAMSYKEVVHRLLRIPEEQTRGRWLSPGCAGSNFLTYCLPHIDLRQPTMTVRHSAGEDGKEFLL